MPASIIPTARAAAEHGASFIGSSVLHLGPELHDYFVGFLASEYPDLVATYDDLYGAKKYAPEAYREHVQRRLHRAKEAAGYVDPSPRWETEVRNAERQEALPLL